MECIPPHTYQWSGHGRSIAAWGAGVGGKYRVECKMEFFGQGVLHTRVCRALTLCPETGPFAVASLLPDT